MFRVEKSFHAFWAAKAMRAWFSDLVPQFTELEIPAMTLAEQLRSRKKALTVEELAELLCIAIRTLYKEVEENHIPFFRVRSAIRFDPHQVADWLDGKMPVHSVLPVERPEARSRA